MRSRRPKSFFLCLAFPLSSGMRIAKYILCLSFVLLFVTGTRAQTDSTAHRMGLLDSLGLFKKNTFDSLGLFKKNSQLQDIVDVYRWVFGFKPPPKKNDTTRVAKKLDIAFLPGFGYSTVTAFAGVISANGAYYADTDPETKLSAINTSVGYTQNNQIIIPILSNIWTKKNTYNLIGDWRYYKYPEYTYGLGGHTNDVGNADKVDYSNLILHEAILRHLPGTEFCAGIAYNLNYHWNISEAGPADGSISDFQKYGLAKTSTSSGISLNALYDSRVNSINPSNAAYASITFCPNFTALGSDQNYRSLLIDLRKYINIGSSGNTLAFWSYNWFTFNGNAPYLDLPSTGWDPYANMGRGYIQSRLRGKNLVYLESEYRFGLLPSGLVGGVIFANVESVTDWPSNKFEVLYPAIGAGLRIKVNKHSNTNVCLDYGFGLNGSNGLFINLGEVF
jgi:hypothetical protein